MLRRCSRFHVIFTRDPRAVVWPTQNFYGDQIFWLSPSCIILFGTTPFNAQNDKKF